MLNRILPVSYSLDPTYLSHATIDICLRAGAKGISTGTKRKMVWVLTDSNWVRIFCYETIMSTKQQDTFHTMKCRSRTGNKRGNVGHSQSHFNIV